MQRVLAITETTSEPFRLAGGIGMVQVSSHSGGTWTLEIEDPDGDWGSTGETWTANGIRAFWSTWEARYRLTGGTVGAKAATYNIVGINLLRDYLGGIDI